MKQTSTSTNTTTNSAPGFNAPTHEQISQRAEELWKKQGCPTDRDEEIWLEAERQLQATASAAKATLAKIGTKRAIARPVSAAAR